MYTYSEELFSDFHKDAYGFRPRDHRFYDTDTTPAEKQEIWDATGRAFAWRQAEEEAAELEAIAKFETELSDIEVLAGDRETAIRWFVESLELNEIDLMYGGNKICWQLGLPYSMANIFDETCKKLLDNVEGIE